MSSESKNIKEEEKLNQKSNENKQKEEKKEKERKYYISGISGFFLSFLIILINIETIITIIIYLNFLIDSKKYNFDRIGLTRLGKNTHFSLCSLYSCVDSWLSSFIFNLIIFFVLFFQEVVISSKWINICKKSNCRFSFFSKIYY